MSKKPTANNEGNKSHASRAKAKQNELSRTRIEGFVGTQPYKKADELDEKFSAIAEEVANHYLQTQKAAWTDYYNKKLSQLERDQLDRGKKLDPREYKAKWREIEKIKNEHLDNIEAASTTILDSIEVRIKIPDRKDPKKFTIESALRDEFRQNDTDLPRYYVSIKLPQDYTRDSFIAAVKTHFDTTIVKEDKLLGKKGDFEVVAATKEHDMLMRSMIVPLEKVIFLPRQAGKEF